MMLKLMGTTHPGPSGNDFDVIGNGIAGIHEPGMGKVHLADYGTNTSATVGFFFVPDGIVSLDYRDQQVGNYLRRPFPNTRGLELQIGVVDRLDILRTRSPTSQVATSISNGTGETGYGDSFRVFVFRRPLLTIRIASALKRIQCF